MVKLLLVVLLCACTDPMKDARECAAICKIAGTEVEEFKPGYDYVRSLCHCKRKH